MKAAVALAVIVTVLATGCEPGDDPGSAFPLRRHIGRPTNSDSLVIGLVGTMSGRDAWRGEDAFEGADLAVHELNESRSSDDRLYELVSLDDKGDPERALELVKDLAALERTVGLLYAGPPGVMPRAEDVLAAGGIPAVVLYGDLYGANSLRSHLFQASPPLVWEARRIASYFASDRKYERVGLLASRSPSGRTATSAMRAAVRTAGDGRPAVARYRSGELLRVPLAKLRRRHAEAVVVEGDAGVLARVATRLQRTGHAYRDTDAARIASAAKGVRRRRLRSDHWHPQLAAFHSAFSRRIDVRLPPGTIVAAPLDRGAYYLPIPSFDRFRRAFEDWWGEGPPFGWQQTAYGGAHMIGWAVLHSREEQDLANTMEDLRGRRFGGLDVSFGPDDHLAVDHLSVGLWVVPRPRASVRERDRLPGGLPWVPLSRGFSSNGEKTDIAPRDWRYLMRKAPRNGPRPSFRKMKFGVTSGRRDPVH
jgi:Periplasmic binding protein